MQTFLPYPSFAQSVRALDPPRLGKQRVEALQLQRALTVPGYAWRNHPAAKMWLGYLPALTRYALEAADAWVELGHADTVREQVLAFAPEIDGIPQDQLDLPPWVGDEDFHRSHQSNLIRKDPERYGALFAGVPPDLPYRWPSGEAVTGRRRSYSAEEVRAAEEPLLAAGVPLMQRAATALALQVRSFHPRRVLVLAGSGNNGGDALFAAAQLAAGGIEVDVWPLGSRIHQEGLAAATSAGAQVVDAPTPADLVIDGILGIGARPPLRGTAREAVTTLLALPIRPVVVAVDLPSGVDPDDGSTDGVVLPADLTVTFGALKHGLVRQPGRKLAGRIVLVDLGLGLPR